VGHRLEGSRKASGLKEEGRSAQTAFLKQGKKSPKADGILTARSGDQS